MITENEMNNINFGIRNIIDSISRMLNILDSIRSKQNILITILKARYHESENTHEQFLALFQLENTLQSLRIRFQNIPIITSEINEQYKAFLQLDVYFQG